MSTPELIHSLASKQFDYASLKGGQVLRIQHDGREMVFYNLSLSWHTTKKAVERDVRHCMICHDADVYMGCIHCGFGYCTSCIHLSNDHILNLLKCTVCTASSELDDLLTGNLSNMHLFKTVIPEFQIEYILSFTDAEQVFGEASLVLKRDNLYLLQADSPDGLVAIQTLSHLVCAILEASNDEGTLPTNLWKISTCIKHNSIYPWNGVLERIPILKALIQRNGKFFFHEVRDDIEQTIVESAAGISFNSVIDNATF